MIMSLSNVCVTRFLKYIHDSLLLRSRTENIMDTQRNTSQCMLEGTKFISQYPSAAIENICCLFKTVFMSVFLLVTPACCRC